MGSRTRTIALASVLIAGVATASALYAQDHGSSGSTTGPGMMNRDGMMGGGMMGMMQRMSTMMDHCANMMEDGADQGRRPNDQWRKHAPTAPERNG